MWLLNEPFENHAFDSKFVVDFWDMFKDALFLMSIFQSITRLNR